MGEYNEEKERNIKGRLFVIFIAIIISSFLTLLVTEWLCNEAWFVIVVINLTIALILSIVAILLVE